MSCFPVTIPSTLGDRGFVTSQLPFNKEILRTFTNELREQVKTKAPGSTRQDFAELANEIRFRDAIANVMAQKSGNQLISFGDFIGGGLGGAFSAFGVVDPVTAIAAGIGTRRLLESVPFKLTSAKALEKVNQAGGVLEKLAPAEQKILLDLVSEIGTTPRNAPQPN